MAYALNRARGGNIVNFVEISKMLLEAGTPFTEDMKKAVTRIGEDFEFHREIFNSPATDAALHFRRVATRYDKLAKSFFFFVLLASIMILVK